MATTISISPKIFKLSGGFRGATGKLTFRGAYSSGTAYSIYDVVSYGGSSYVKTITGSSGVLPTDATKWQLMAQGYDITVSSSAPSNPTSNSLWVDTSS